MVGLGLWYNQVPKQGLKIKISGIVSLIGPIPVGNINF